MPSPLIRLAALPVVLCVFAGAPSSAAEGPFASRAEHVVLVVWDGMRPDSVTSENTPNLQALAARGTWFAHHHSTWPTTTEVNGTVLATGAFPCHSQIVANREYRPKIDPRKAVPVESAEIIRRGDELSEGHYLGAPTVAEIARQAGLSTAIAGTKPVALLHDRAATRPPTPFSGIVYAGKAYPVSLLEPIVAALGVFPNYDFGATDPKPNTAGNQWTTRALLEHLWAGEIPRYSVLWLSDPDYPQHMTAPGHPAARGGIHDSDVNLGLVVAELEKRGALEKTDIFVVSDHGFSTVERTVDPVGYFNAHKVTVSQEFTSPPQPGHTLSVNVGGATGIYVVGHQPEKIRALVELLQKSDFAGPIFTRDSLPGTFALGTAHLDSPDAADIVFSFRWSEGANAHGVPGLITAESRTGSGMHGTLSRFDTHNTLVAAGPDIRAGFRDEFPTGNLDVAPTILQLLGLPLPASVDGRVLTEALAALPLPTEQPTTRRLEAQQEFTSGWIFKDTVRWKQYLQTTTFAGKTYLDEGNAVSGR